MRVLSTCNYRILTIPTSNKISSINILLTIKPPNLSSPLIRALVPLWVKSMEEAPLTKWMKPEKSISTRITTAIITILKSIHLLQTLTGQQENSQRAQLIIKALPLSTMQPIFSILLRVV